MIIKLSLVLLAIMMLNPSTANGQSFGFGCLGLVGGFGGYSFQRYQPTGLNNYIDSFNEFRGDSLINPMKNFGTATGYRVGINFFRADFQGFILTTKGFYQSVIEKQHADISGRDGLNNYSYELKISNWGIGIDLGTSITSSFSWKVIDASLLFNTVVFTDNRNFPNGFTYITEYKSESVLGYSIGTGFIYSIVAGYVSLEGLAGYTRMSIENVKADNDVGLTTTDQSEALMTNFIDNGGFIGVIQINFSFPL